MGLYVSPGIEGCGIVVAENGIDKGGGKVAASSSAFYDDLRDMGEGMHPMLRLTNVYKAYGSGYDAGGSGLTQSLGSSSTARRIASSALVVPRVLESSTTRGSVI